ncbi:uncharacterized protein LOC113646995 isoform X1 [Tachysurus fulvidraco]|uniref:uncharacterized protein LOC113646995 isoform X1 n=1 Tax=Tachysurus fulvidraco TaxID=1234273 RepID=UPI001FEFB0A9|nr:uncharacterized protein LOC113646995 isoform X1 [Tachysurus fulvidraco]
MSLLYISILWVCACVDSAESLVTVSAAEGSTVILPCKLTEEFKLTSFIRWQINKFTVFERSSNGTYSGSGYKGRVDVPVDELRKGNCSLVMKNVRFTDDGFYKTFTVERVDINTAGPKEINNVTLSVYGFQISAPVGSTAVLPCDWSHLYIKTPYIKWFIGKKTVFERKGKDSYVGEGYEGRVDVPEDELLKGNCSLVMKNISVTDTEIYISAMLITDTQESVLVQKVKLSVVEDSVNKGGSSSEDSDSDQTGGNNWIILYVGIVIIIIIICVSVYYSRVKGWKQTSQCSVQHNIRQCDVTNSRHTTTELMTNTRCSALSSSWISDHLKLHPCTTELTFISGASSPCQDLLIYCRAFHCN